MSTAKRLHFKKEGRENGLPAIGGQDLSGPNWRKRNKTQPLMQSSLGIGIRKSFIKMGLSKSMTSLFDILTKIILQINKK